MSSTNNASISVQANSQAQQSLNPYDVVWEGEKTTQDHPGNRNLQRLVTLNLPLFETATDEEREYIVESIIGSILQDGGRFLKLVAKWPKSESHSSSTTSDTKDGEDDKSNENNVWILKEIGREERQKLVKVSLDDAFKAYQEEKKRRNTKTTSARIPFQERAGHETNIQSHSHGEDHKSVVSKSASVCNPSLPRPKLFWSFSPIQMQRRKRSVPIQSQDPIEIEYNDDEETEERYSNIDRALKRRRLDFFFGDWNNSELSWNSFTGSSTMPSFAKTTLPSVDAENDENVPNTPPRLENRSQDQNELHRSKATAIVTPEKPTEGTFEGVVKWVGI